MLTSLTVRNFKRFELAEIELGAPVVFVGPNNSGKTSALQALALWSVGAKRWIERRSGARVPSKRPGVTINRRDLIAIPVPYANLLWRDLHTRSVNKTDGRQRTQNVRVEVIVEGVSGNGKWSCGLEFDYANEESIYCRPLRFHNRKSIERMPVPDEAAAIEIAFLPPMSGLAATETRLDPGAVDVRIGEGRTAEVLRNLCYRVHSEDLQRWQDLVNRIELLFGVEIEAPKYAAERGEVSMRYRERGNLLDLSSSGRGLQQTLLLLAYLYANPGAVLLLDEPDAHLEILRQRQIYQLVTEAAKSSGGQIIAASHSEVLLNEAAERDTVIAFIGAPHRVDDRISQLRKSLLQFGFEHYVQAEQTGWVLYLEGSTDLAQLQAYAMRTGRESAARALERPFVQYVGNQMQRARSHFHAIRESKPDLRGIAVLDDFTEEQSHRELRCTGWRKREIENYLCTRRTLEAYADWLARKTAAGPLFEHPLVERYQRAMRESIDEIEEAMARLGRGSPWNETVKVSDDFLIPLFDAFFKKLAMPNLMPKNGFYRLVEHIPDDEIDGEIIEKLDAIAEVAALAQPANC